MKPKKELIGLDIVGFLDIPHEYENSSFSISVPVYCCPKTKEYVICFEPQKDVSIIAKTPNFFQIGHELQKQMLKYYRKI